MKQLTCEICGSTEIKKIDDSTFVCQSCGVQYTKDEVKKLLVEITGKVEIDHTDEIKNTIKRAKQFETEGDHIKAKEYYNKALDMDADNETIQKKVADISAKQELDKYYIVDPKIDPKQNIRNFLKQLATEENIACDIYKEIGIKSITEKYYTFILMKAKCECEWSAIVCNRHFENETVYVDRYNTNTKKTEKVPETKQIEKIQRTPRSGSYVYDCESLNFSSNNSYDIISIDDKSKKCDLLLEFESLQKDKFENYSLGKIDPRQVTKKDGKFFYKGYELDVTVDESVFIQKRDSMLKKADEMNFEKVKQQIGGDFYEGLNAKRRVLSKSISYICIPVQIINYTYKGANYIAVSDLVSHTTSIPEIYPSDNEITVNKTILSDEKTKLSNTISRMNIASLIIEIFAFILLFVGGALNLGILVIISLIFIFLASIPFFVGIAIKMKKEKELNQIRKNIFGEQTSIRTTALSKSYEAFFAVYDKSGSLEEAKKAIHVDYPTVRTHIELSPAGKSKEFYVLSKESSYHTVNEVENILNQTEKLKVKRLLYMVIGAILCITVVFLLLGILMIKKANEFYSQICINEAILDLKYDVINGSATTDESEVSIEILDCSIDNKKGTFLTVMLVSGILKKGNIINLNGNKARINSITVLQQRFNNNELPKSNVDCVVEKLKIKLNLNITDDFSSFKNSIVKCTINQ